MKYAMSLFLLLSILFLPSCETVVELGPDRCKLFDKIEFSEDTKEWLRQQEQPLPAYVLEDLDEIADHNQVYELQDNSTNVDTTRK